MIYRRHKSFKEVVCLNRERALAFIYWQERADFLYKKRSFHNHPMLSINQIAAVLLPRPRLGFCLWEGWRRSIFSEYFGDRAEQPGQALNFWSLVKPKARRSLAGETKQVLTTRRRAEGQQNKSSWAVSVKLETPRAKCHPKYTALHQGCSVKPCLPPDAVPGGSHGSGMPAGSGADACQL